MDEIDELQPAYDEAWELLDETNSLLNPLREKKEAREAVEGEATAVLDAIADWEGKEEEFDEKHAAYDEVWAEWDAANDEGKEALQQQLDGLEREAEKARREMEALDEARWRAEDAAWRRELLEGMQSDLAAAQSEWDYLHEQIGVNGEKLEFLGLFWDAQLDTDEGWAMRDALDEQSRIYYELDADMREQLAEVDTHISNINFEIFIQEQ
jgi:hypothetical protein